MRRLAALIAAVALLAGGAAASAAPKDLLTSPALRIGLQDDQLPVAAPSLVPGRVATLASTGAVVTRLDVLWSDVAPARPAAAHDPNDPAYRWGQVDAAVDALAARGRTVIISVYRSPAWANGGRTVEWAPDPVHYERFMRALARRYSGTWRDRAGVVHARVGLFEPWNEPNMPMFLRPQWNVAADGTVTPASPAIYAGLLAAAWRAVKGAQPDAGIIGVSGGPNGSDRPPEGSMGIVTFIRGLVPFAPRMDAYAQHLYPALAPSVSVAMPSFRRIPDLLAELDRVRRGLPLLITEMGYTTQASPYRAVYVTEEQQAAYVSEAVAELRRHPRVKLGVWFNMQDNPGWPAGLQRADGTRKPSWDVFAATPKLIAR